MKTFDEKILNFCFGLPKTLKTPKEVGVIYPFEQAETRRVMKEFYSKYYHDSNPRYFLFGINPGRFGAGVTGVPFTCPKRLVSECGIANNFDKKPELSSEFVYLFKNEFGGVEEFCKYFFITSLSPLGFIKDGKNYNYYDDKKLEKMVTPFIVESIDKQLELGGRRDAAICIGMGQNAKFFKKLNEKHQFFEKIIPLPHPRWVMQYRRKTMDVHLNSYVDTLLDLASKID